MDNDIISMNIKNFWVELYSIGWNQKVYFQPIIDDEPHIINKIECKNGDVYLIDSLMCNPEGKNCLEIKREIENLVNSGQIKMDEQTKVYFIYTENNKKVVCNEIVKPFIKEDNNTYIKTFVSFIS